VFVKGVVCVDVWYMVCVVWGSVGYVCMACGAMRAVYVL